MTVKFKLDSRTVPEGTVLLFGVRYQGEEYQDRADSEKIYTYAMIKAGGYWYVTGGGRTPQAAGWGAIERWLARDGRVVEWVKHVTQTAQLWPETHAEAAEEEPLNPGGMNPDGSIDGSR